MSIVRMGEVQAHPGQEDALRDFLLTAVAPNIEASPGCEACQVLQHQDEPTRFVIIEVWTDVAAHQASVRNIPPEMLQEGRSLFAGGTAGAYYHLLRS
jgi:quinol monooxygenase YgiN